MVVSVNVTNGLRQQPARWLRMSLVGARDVRVEPSGVNATGGYVLGVDGGAEPLRVVVPSFTRTGIAQAPAARRARARAPRRPPGGACWAGLGGRGAGACGTGRAGC